MHQQSSIHGENEVIRGKYRLNNKKAVIRGLHRVTVAEIGLLCCCAVWLGYFFRGAAIRRPGSSIRKLVCKLTFSSLCHFHWVNGKLPSSHNRIFHFLSRLLHKQEEVCYYYRFTYIQMDTVKKVSQCLLSTGCFTPCGHYCRMWFPRSLWSKNSYKHVSGCGRLRSYDHLKLRIEGNDYWQ
jgi:hypothetical protein